MGTDEVESVLANWIDQALSSIGRLSGGLSPSAWVAARFAEWWRTRADDAMADAESATSSVREELMRLGGWGSFGEALHDLAHLQDALLELRGLMRLPDEPDMPALEGGVRGKYLERHRDGTNLALLEPDVRAAFPTDEDVNRALRSVMQAEAGTAGPTNSLDGHGSSEE